MSFTITTVYPDGRREERQATEEEVAQREVDMQRFLEQKEIEDSRIIEIENVKNSARSKLKSQGFTDAEIDVLYPSLI